MQRLPWVVAVVGTILVWMPALSRLPDPLWPSLLATVGVWLLAGMWGALRGGGKRRR